MASDDDKRFAMEDLLRQVKIRTLIESDENVEMSVTVKAHGKEYIATLTPDMEMYVDITHRLKKEAEMYEKELLHIGNAPGLIIHGSEQFGMTKFRESKRQR